MGGFANTDFMEERESHYQRFFGELDQPVMHSTDLQEVHVDIYQFPPTVDRPYWTLITGGMSDEPQPGLGAEEGGVARRAEIMLYAHSPAGWMFSVLKGLAEMPFDSDTYLHWHHTVPNGKPMTAGPSKLTSFFFLPPYFEAKEFDTLRVGGESVDTLWLVPITEEERSYAVEYGGQKLADRMSECEMSPVIDESRQSIV